MRKLISVVVPTYNEEANVITLAGAITEVFANELPEYDYEILFIDNHSKDSTQEKIRELCKANPKIKAIFNARNFGQARSPVYGMKQAYGDCVIRICADFQDPVEMIVPFVREWEKGWKIVIGVKKASREKGALYMIRGMFYKIMNRITEIDHIEQFTGFGLYDRRFVDVVRSLHDPLPYLRGIIAELGFDYKRIEYEQPMRRAGKSKNNLYSLYDYGMIGVTSYSKVVLRLATFVGFGGGDPKPYHRDGLPRAETDVLGPLFRELCPYNDRHALPWIRADALYRLSRGICPQHQLPGSRPAPGRGGGADQF